MMICPILPNLGLSVCQVSDFGSPSRRGRPKGERDACARAGRGVELGLCSSALAPHQHPPPPFSLTYHTTTTNQKSATSTPHPDQATCPPPRHHPRRPRGRTRATTSSPTLLRPTRPRPRLGLAPPLSTCAHLLPRHLLRPTTRPTRPRQVRPKSRSRPSWNRSCLLPRRRGRGSGPCLAATRTSTRAPTRLSRRVRSMTRRSRSRKRCGPSILRGPSPALFHHHVSIHLNAR